MRPEIMSSSVLDGEFESRVNLKSRCLAERVRISSPAKERWKEQEWPYETDGCQARRRGFLQVALVGHGRHSCRHDCS